MIDMIGNAETLVDEFGDPGARLAAFSPRRNRTLRSTPLLPQGRKWHKIISRDL